MVSAFCTGPNARTFAVTSGGIADCCAMLEALMRMLTSANISCPNCMIPPEATYRRWSDTYRYLHPLSPTACNLLRCYTEFSIGSWCEVRPCAVVQIEETVGHLCVAVNSA